MRTSVVLGQVRTRNIFVNIANILTSQHGQATSQQENVAQKNMPQPCSDHKFHRIWCIFSSLDCVDSKNIGDKFCSDQPSDIKYVKFSYAACFGIFGQRM